ncbi:MAG: hypothetical protein ABEJ70_01465 [Halobacteriaceae archaeon]
MTARDGDRARLVRSRVVRDAGAALADALDRGLTGYARLAPADAVLLDEPGAGVLALRDGAPVRAHHTGTGRTGADALADLVGAAPFRVELYDAAPPADGDAVDPGTAADLLADDPDLAARTRRAAPADVGAADDSLDAVEAFLADEDHVEAVRERARAEAERRAAEWGLDVDG